MKAFDNISWPKAALFGVVALLLVGVFHPPTQERVMNFIIRMTELISTALGGVQ